MTMAATTRGGVCLRFREPVRGIDPLGIVRHPGITLGVDDVDGFLRAVRDRLDRAATPGPGEQAPDHAEGGWVAAMRAVYHWNRRDVAHEQRDVDRVDLPALDRAGDVDDQPVEVATGPMFHRRYRIVADDADLDAEAAMTAIQADPNVLADVRLAPFTKVRGAAGEMRVGDRYVIEIAGPWKGAVEVIAVTPRSLRLATLEGHMESGVIEMRTESRPAGGATSVVFTIESWARSHDRFLDVMYDKLGIAQALQSEMWATACDRFADLVGGVVAGPLDVVTERAPA
jgi:hypothetical protein